MAFTKFQDLKYYRNQITWINSYTYCKLDQVLVDDDWMEVCLNFYALFEVLGISDHSPALIFLKNENKVQKCPFRFKNVWIEDASFLPLVKKV